MKKTIRSVTIITALAVLLAACGAQAAGQTVNILLLDSETEDGGFYMTIPLIVSLDFANHSIRVVHIHNMTEIRAVTREKGELKIPVNALSHCEYSEIVNAFENAFGVTIDRYVNYRFVYGDFGPTLKLMGAFCPITLDIPEELTGDKKYVTVNGYMAEITSYLGTDFTPIMQAGPQELDALSLTAYFGAMPDRLWKSGDQFTMVMEEYKYNDMKYRAVIEGMKTKIAQMDQAEVLAFWHVLTDGQDTDVTAKDIAAWSAVSFNFIDDAPYLTVPGFEGVEMTASEASSLPGAGNHHSMMLSYDTAAAAQAVQAFLGGE
jgi:hypothetical protein